MIPGRLNRAAVQALTGGTRLSVTARTKSSARKWCEPSCARRGVGGVGGKRQAGPVVHRRGARGERLPQRRVDVGEVRVVGGAGPRTGTRSSAETSVEVSLSFQTLLVGELLEAGLGAEAAKARLAEGRVADPAHLVGPHPPPSASPNRAVAFEKLLPNS